MAEQVDYDYNPGDASGRFLNLKVKGDIITIRLADKPIVYFVHWLDNKPVICRDAKTCQQCAILTGFTPEEMKKKENSQLRRRQTFLWSVIDRADGQAKIFKGGKNIFLAIKEFALNPKWGGAEKDATRFDITVTRTETSLQNFYSVVPDPTSLSKLLTEEEKAEVAKLATLIDTVVEAENVEPDELPNDESEVSSEGNSSNSEDFIASLEEGMKKEEEKK